MQRSLIFLFALCPALLFGVDDDTTAKYRRLSEQLGNEGYITNITIGSGIRVLDDAGWQGFDQLWAIDGDYDIRPAGWPVGLALGVHSAWGSVTANDNRRYKMQVWELALGAVRDQPVGPIMLRGGLAPTFTSARLERGSWKENSSTWGATGWLTAYWLLDDKWSFGATGRYHWTGKVDYELTRERGDLSGYSLVMQAGVRF